MSPVRRVPFVGLTGGIGAGKSEALRGARASWARRRSRPTPSCTSCSRPTRCATRWSSAWAPRWRPTGRGPGRVAELVFGEPERRARGSRACSGRGWARGSRLARRRSSGAIRRRAAAVVEVPLLFEAGMEGVFDHTIAVVAEEEVRRERAGGARARGARSARPARQLSAGRKRRSERTSSVRNDGSLEELREGCPGSLRRSKAMSSATATRTRMTPRRAARRGAPPRARSRSGWWLALIAAGAVAVVAGRRPAGRRGAGDHAAAAPRGHHPPAGAGQGPRPRR